MTSAHFFRPLAKKEKPTAQIQDRFAKKRAEIDEEIQLLRNRIADLLAARNSLTPIGTLPSEVLTTIFAFTQREISHPAHGGQVNAKTLLKITCVCRHWRLIALDDALLWAEINESNYKWSAEWFKRSKKADLVIDASYTDGWPAAFFETLLPEASRIQWFAISGADHLAHAKLWEAPMPRLQTFKLLDYRIADYFDSLKLPALSTLEFDCCQFTKPLRLSSFSSLRRLTIISPKDLTTKSFFHGLSSAVNLVSLTLMGHEGWDVREEDVSQISLPKISKLSINYLPLPLLIQFIRRVSIPSKARISIRCKTTKTEEAAIPELLKCFPWRDTDALCQCSINFLFSKSSRENHRHSLRMTYRQKTDGEWVEGGGDLDISVIFASKLSSVLSSILQPPMNDLEDLRVHTPADDMKLTWANPISPLPNLEIVGARCRAASTFMETFISMNIIALRSDMKQLIHTPTPSLPFPSLKVLILKRRRLFTSPTNLESFCKVLEMRNAYGLGLRRLEMYEHEGLDVDRLEFIVDELRILEEPQEDWDELRSGRIIL